MGRPRLEDTYDMQAFEDLYDQLCDTEHEGSLRQALSDRLGISPYAVDRRIRRMFERTPQEATEAPPEAAEDPVALRRLKDENARLRASVEAAERRAVEAEDIRAGVLGLTAERLKPRLTVPPAGTGQGDRRTVVLHLTDLHYGETVKLDEMDGANSYSEEIANARLGRYFDTVTKLMTKHWSGTLPERVVLLLGGDLISGDIHAELTQSNWSAVPETVKKVSERIAGGIAMIAARVGCRIDVYVVPGNHGRLTFKPVSKGRAATSWDLLVADFAEACVKGAGIEDVYFHSTRSPDAYFSTYGFHWLLNHGDTTGSRGGQGFIGASATIVRGHRKLIDTAWRSGRPVHYVVTGHLHTTLRTPFGFSGGSLVGYSEYSRDGRFDPEPAKQLMLVVHEKRGVIAMNEIYVGAANEGSHYHGPASIIRPSMEDAA